MNNLEQNENSLSNFNSLSGGDNQMGYQNGLVNNSQESIPHNST